MDTKLYRTKTIFNEMNNQPASINSNVWPIGLDIGYSAVKTFSGNAAVCFPSYAAINTGTSQINVAGNEDQNRIKYADEDGEIWDVGASAQDNISVSDTSAGSLAIYGRSRYYSPMFKVLARVGIAVGMRKNQFGDPTGKTLVLQTGLPPKYINSDQGMMMDVLKGRHRFSICIGSGSWENFDFTINSMPNVIDQPQGTLFSISTNASMTLTTDARKYFSSRMLIVDPGFGTLDTFPMIRGSITRDNCETDSNLGMKQVFKETSDEIFDKFGFEVSVPAMQQFLETGMVLKREGRAYKKVPFDDILEKHSRDICKRALERIIDIYNPLVEFDYMVVTGGTGAAWIDFILNDEDFKNSETLQILSGNQGDPSLPYIFANARGYYIYAMSRSAA